jgi:hypothetical protein
MIVESIYMTMLNSSINCMGGGGGGDDDNDGDSDVSVQHFLNSQKLSGCYKNFLLLLQ